MPENWQTVNDSVTFTGNNAVGPLIYFPSNRPNRWRIKCVCATLTGGGGQTSQSVQYSIVSTVGTLWQNVFTAPSLQAGLTVSHSLGYALAKDSEAALGGIIAAGTMPIPIVELGNGNNDSLLISLGTVAFAAGGSITLRIQFEYDLCAQ